MPTTGGDAYRAAVDTVVWVVAKDSHGSYHHGTGVIVNEGILTSLHVVKGRKVSVVFPARDASGQVIGEAKHYFADAAKHLYPCKVDYTDATRDLALLQTRAVLSGRKRAVLSGGTASPGEQVFSIGGNGRGAWRFSRGDVRQVRRQVDGPSAGVKYVESSLPLNDGDSGGAMFDVRGYVLAIHSSSSKEMNLVNQSVAITEIRKFLKAYLSR